MKKYLNSVEEVLKELKEGKEVFGISENGYAEKYKIIDGVICDSKYINTSLNFKGLKYYTEEAELLKFEINRAYKTRGGYKAFLDSKGVNDMIFLCASAIGNKIVINYYGKVSNNRDSLMDIVGYWEE